MLPSVSTLSETAACGVNVTPLWRWNAASCLEIERAVWALTCGPEAGGFRLYIKKYWEQHGCRKEEANTGCQQVIRQEQWNVFRDLATVLENSVRSTMIKSLQRKLEPLWKASGLLRPNQTHSTPAITNSAVRGQTAHRSKFSLSPVLRHRLKHLLQLETPQKKV